MIYVDTYGHMISDVSLSELHGFARRLGLRREWFQNHVRHPHYDLTTVKMRRKAQVAGAIMVDRRKLVSILKEVDLGE